METQSSLPNKGGRALLPIFGPFLLCPNGSMHQDATRYGGRPQPRQVCVRWGLSPSTKRRRSPSPILRVQVRISKLDRKCGALPVVANFVALEQQIILVKTRSESVYKWPRYKRKKFCTLGLRNASFTTISRLSRSRGPLT